MAKESMENSGHPGQNAPVIAGADWVHGQQAARFGDYEQASAKKRTRRERFLAEKVA
jgi:hypothetical protein